jgi:serine/threonine protein kinase
VRGIADQNGELLTWEQRVNIAQDISRGLEYLHEGVSMPYFFLSSMLASMCLYELFTMLSRCMFHFLCHVFDNQMTLEFWQAVPPVIHRDIKAANILLDATMTARVSLFTKIFTTHGFSRSFLFQN